MDPVGLLASNPKHRAEGLEGSQCPVRDAGRLRVGLHFSQGTGATQAGTPFPEGRFKIADTSASLFLRDLYPRPFTKTPLMQMTSLYFSHSSKI